MSGPILPGGGRRELREPEAREAREGRSYARRSVGGVSEAADQAQADADQALADAAAADLEAARANGSLDGWAYDTDRTYINGGYLQTGTVVAAAIHAAGITADKVTVGADSAFETNYDPSVAKAAADSAQATADSASASATGANDTLDLWAYDGARTEIKGGNLRAGSVTAHALAALTFVSGLYMESSSFDGTFNADGTINGTGTTGWAVDWNGDAVFHYVSVRGDLHTGVAGSAGIDVVGNDLTFRNTVGGQAVKIQTDGSYECRFYGNDAFSFMPDGRAYTNPLLYVGGGNVNVAGILIAQGNVRPHTADDGNLNLGTSVARWKSVWAVDTTINSSDMRTKSTIEDSALGLDFVRQIRPVSFVRQGRSRPHYGFVAQQVKQVIDRLGVDFAGYVDPQVGEPDAVQENGDPPFLGLRYSEFIAPLMSAVQELADDRDALRARVDDLEARMAALEAS